MTQRLGLTLFLAVLTFAQTGRDEYREAYRVWRQADPTLERDAESAGPALGADADRVANEAAKYGAQRAAFLSQTAAADEHTLAWLQQPPSEIFEVADASADVLEAETKGVRRIIDTYASDPDPAIQQLRGMLERENAALSALGAAIVARHKAEDALRPAALTAERDRLAALTATGPVAAGMRESIEQATREASAWADYYRTLSDGARGITATPLSAPSAAPDAGPIERRPSITPIPLARYIGAWTFPATNGLFHGPQPEFVDLVVHEEDGQAQGTMYGRFKVTSGDPLVRFDFKGEFKDTRNQIFPLVTSDGATGTLELIPGPAFNLLEINFKTEAKPGKIHQGNVILVKK